MHTMISRKRRVHTRNITIRDSDLRSKRMRRTNSDKQTKKEGGARERTGSGHESRRGRGRGRGRGSGRSGRGRGRGRGRGHGRGRGSRSGSERGPENRSGSAQTAKRDSNQLKKVYTRRVNTLDDAQKMIQDDLDTMLYKNEPFRLYIQKPYLQPCSSQNKIRNAIQECKKAATYCDQSENVLTCHFTRADVRDDIYDMLRNHINVRQIAKDRVQHRDTQIARMLPFAYQQTVADDIGFIPCSSAVFSNWARPHLICAQL